MTLRTLNYGNYGIFLIMGHAGFCPSTVVTIVISINSSNSIHKPYFPIPVLVRIGFWGPLYCNYSKEAPKFYW